MKSSWLYGLVAFVWFSCCLNQTATAEDTWRFNWVTPSHFSLDIDTEGFDLPSAIAFVPNPGREPKDPLYFVTELRGKVKVVTNDRSIYTFAENFFKLIPKKELPDQNGEIGMAAITLDPAHGYVFVSFAYQDDRNVYRNNIVRFDSRPRTFGLKAMGAISFADIFGSDTSTPHHFVGGMVVEGDTLFVSVGDGHQVYNSQNLNSTSGKILRMTLDGKPLPNNPFYQDSNVRKARNFVWALGTRNPFGLTAAHGRLFAVENGLDSDRFFEVRRGENYNWDGTDWSIGMNVPMVFSPAVVPVQMAWLPAESSVFPEEYKSKIYVALAGGIQTRGVIYLDYDFDRSRMGTRPRQFLQYIGDNDTQMLVGVAFGPDGLYAVPLYPVRRDKDAKGAVLRISYAQTKVGPVIDGQTETAQAIMRRAACIFCHSFDSRVVLLIGPPLDDETLVPRILSRLDSDEYKEQLRAVDAMTIEPYISYRKARREVMSATETERARLWIKYRIMNPNFDRTDASMPITGLKEIEATKVADYLVGRYRGADLLSRIQQVFGKLIPRSPDRKHIVAAFVMGICSAFALLLTFHGLRRLFSYWKHLRWNK
jgi:glucose/arabinose dehydrogenase